MCTGCWPICCSVRKMIDRSRVLGLSPYIIWSLVILYYYIVYYVTCIWCICLSCARVYRYVLAMSENSKSLWRKDVTSCRGGGVQPYTLKKIYIYNRKNIIFYYFMYTCVKYPFKDPFLQR